MNAVFRRKVLVEEVIHHIDENGNAYVEAIDLCAISEEENDTAEIQLQIVTLADMRKLTKGQEFYIDFTPVETE